MCHASQKEQCKDCLGVRAGLQMHLERPLSSLWADLPPPSHVFVWPVLDEARATCNTLLSGSGFQGQTKNTGPAPSQS